MNRVDVLQELKRYYSAELAEDKQDGTRFDCAVLDAIDNLITAQQGGQADVCQECGAKLTPGNPWCQNCGSRQVFELTYEV